MSVSSLQDYLKEQKLKIDAALIDSIEGLQTPKVLKDAMIYSVKAGGKRLRPILLLETLRAFDKDEQLGMNVACALELIHTYSLIHDDLPSMDNDDLRRGLPTNHKVFGEANAILAGDGLLTHSFRVITESEHSELTASKKVALIAELSKAAGPEGMVGGQTADMAAEEQEVSLEELEAIHEHKTGKLLQFSVKAGALLSEADESQMKNLEQFAKHLGLAFQIKDDILDIEGDEEKIGKPVGSDAGLQKSTYPKLLTLEGAKEKCNTHFQYAIKALHHANINHQRLEELATFITQRDH
ncbi:polyprenyl synthetase family protein [Bacillus tianshenii]|nr:polyprenyl synthetase family protein [Bacillus tianshenii]